MKKIYLLLALLACVFDLSAQKQYRIWQNGESTRVTISDSPVITYGSNGSTVTLGGTTYQTADIDSICPIHQVFVNYSGATATVSIPAAVAADVTANANGAYVTITNNNVSNEVEFVLSGSSTDGAFTYNGAYKATIVLNGLSLTSNQGAALDLQCGKRMALVLGDGTVNTLADYAKGEQKGSLYCKGHLEVEGAGTLNVTGNLTHAIKVKEYMQLKKSTGTINIVSAVGDAIHMGQYYLQNGGTVNITSTTKGDGIQVELLTLDDDVTPDPDEENNGQVMINGGSINIEVASEDCEAIKCDSLVTISGGTFNITASGNGSRGIQTDGDMVINENSNATNITIAATGNLCTNEDDADDPHRCMGIKVDGNLTITAGTVTVTNTGKKSRGIKVGGTYTVSGTANVTANVKN